MAWFAKNLYNIATMTTQPRPYHIQFSFGRDINNPANPHRVNRPGGTNLWILEYTVSGKGWIRCADKIFSITTGDIVIFRPGVPQDYGMDQAHGAWDHLWVCFDPRPPWLDWLNWPELGPDILYMTVPQDDLREHVQQRLEEALTYMRGPLKRRAEFGMNILEEILLWCDTFNPNGDQARLDSRIRRVLKTICENYSQAWPLANLARVACLSPSRFSHLFKKQVGQSPQQWVETYRVTRAAELLIMTNKTVAEIAAETGFNDAFYFSRVFHRHRGASPRSYRRQ